jgi:hypothetical protein
VILLTPQSILIYSLVWFVAVTWHFFRAGQFKASHFRFSIFNYYVMMSAFVIAVIINSYKDASWTPLIYFGVFALAGVVGETLVSMWWRIYFAKRFWVYTVETVDHGFTSWLNFIPWAVGGTLYIAALERFFIDPFDEKYASLWAIAGALVCILFVLQFGLNRLLRHSSRHYRKVTTLNLFLFYWPIVAFIVVLAWLYGPVIYEITFLFAFVATTAEYFFGKATEFFISKKLWTYTYLSIDRGHFTLLSVPLFALGGFYFWSIALVMHQFIR